MTFWIPRSSRGMTEKGIIQRSYKMMSIVKPRLLRRGEFTLKKNTNPGCENNNCKWISYMRTKNSIIRFFFMFFLSVIITGGLTWAGSEEEYAPQVGQQGKDVVWVPTPQSLVDKMLDMAKVTTRDYLIDL